MAPFSAVSTLLVHHRFLTKTGIYLLRVNNPDTFIQDDIRSAIIELSTLQYQFYNAPIKYINRNKKLLENIEQVLNCTSWSGSSDELIAAQAISKASFFGLRNGLIKIQDGADIISQLICTLPPKKWFSSGRVIFGTSFLFRSLLLLCKTDYREKFFDYTKDVCERLLTKVEIKQEKIFNFVGYESDGTFLILEQMRFNRVVLEISSIFNDLRFLNAALKTNDRLYNYFSRLKLSNNTTNQNIQKIIVAIYYTAGIKMQEELYNTALYER